jgi:hypothetical protein
VYFNLFVYLSRTIFKLNQKEKIERKKEGRENLMKRKTQVKKKTERRHSGDSSDSYSEGILFKFSSEIIITAENILHFTCSLEENTDKEPKIGEKTAAVHRLPNYSIINHSTI